jgi:hypothetical protein
MSTDLRVALRIQANAGNSRREINALNRDLRQAGKEGAKSLANESRNARTAVSGIGRAGVVSYKLIRQSMRDSTKAGRDFRSQTIQSTQSIKQLAQAARVAATQTKSHLRSAEQQGVRPLSLSVDRTSTSFRQLARAAANSGRIIKSVSAVARTEFSRIKGLMGSTNGLLAGAGLGIGAATAIGASSRTERQVIQLGQTAEMTPAERLEFKNEAFRVAKAYGNDPDAIISGGAALLAGGLSPKAAKSSIDAIGQANAVRGADPTVLAGVGMAAKEAYGFDLENPSAMLEILQKMTIAGDAAKAELENLGDIFNKVGANASAAGFKFHQSLGLIESLSNVEPNPENLRTMVGNFLTVFNTGSYQKQVSEVTGTKFFNKDKSRRDPFEVISQLKRKYEAIPNDEGRAKFWNVAFKSMDRETVSAWRWMLSGDRQSNMFGISDKVLNSAPIFSQQLKENTASSSGTAGRMRATLRDATDRMAQPINKAFANMGTYLLDGLNLSGEQLLGMGAATAVGGYYAGRGLRKGAGALLGKLPGVDNPLNTMKGIAVGKVLEEATGVTSVYVTNWPSDLGSRSAVGALGDIATDALGGRKGKLGSILRAGAVGAAANAALRVVAPSLMRSPILAGAFIPGSTPQDDATNLRMAEHSKLLNEGEKKYITGFYRNRMSLSGQYPSAASSWISDQARRLTQGQTGLTSAGTSVDGANSWAAGVANRAVDSGMATIAAAKRLNELLGKPLVIEIRTDSDHIFAEVERRLDIQLRRGQ